VAEYRGLLRSTWEMDMTVPQISIRLPKQEKERFEEYAISMGLKASELAKLLIVREQRYRKRLGKLAASSNRAVHARKSTGLVREMPKVTAHMSSVQDVQEFDVYARQHGMDRNGAGAWLLRQELQERWLARALKAR
jgi:hypothetical protein